MDEIHLEVFSKIRIKKTNDSLEFWVESKQPDFDRIPVNKPSGVYQYDPVKERKVFELDHQLELIRKYLLNNGWKLIQITESQGVKWYEFYYGSCMESSDTEDDVSEIMVYAESLAALNRSEGLKQQQQNALFGVNYKGMPIALANSLWWYCVKIIRHISGSRPWVGTNKGPKQLRHINMDAIHLEVFSKIRIKKINHSLEFWVECKQPDNGIIPENKPTYTWRYNPDKMRSVFQPDNQLELIRTYLLNNGWRSIQETLSQELELYEFHHG